jgi:hypothetical protein
MAKNKQTFFGRFPHFKLILFLALIFSLGLTVIAANTKTNLQQHASTLIIPTKTGCIASPAYNGDLCGPTGYRLITSLNASSACYSLSQCLQLQSTGDGTCVQSPTYTGDLCDGYRWMPGISRSCYTLKQCLAANKLTPTPTPTPYKTPTPTLYKSLPTPTPKPTCTITGRFVCNGTQPRICIKDSTGAIRWSNGVNCATLGATYICVAGGSTYSSSSYCKNNAPDCVAAGGVCNYAGCTGTETVKTGYSCDKEGNGMECCNR